MLLNWVLFPPPLLFLNQKIVHWSETCRAGVTVYHPSLPRGSATLNIAPPPILPPCPFSNWEPLVHTGDPERPISPWAGRPRGSGSPCADSGSVNRADGFWQIHSDWKSFILQDFFSLFFMKPPIHKKSCPSTFRWNIVGLDSWFHGHLGNTLKGSNNRKYAFYLLRRLKFDPECFWQYATKTNTIFSAGGFCNCLSWCLY